MISGQPVFIISSQPVFMISSYGIPVGMTKKTADGINNGKEFKVEPHYAKSWYFNRSAPECEVQEDDSMVGKDTQIEGKSFSCPWDRKRVTSVFMYFTYF